MKKYGFLWLMMLCMIALPSCKDDDEDVYETYKEWREENERFIEKIKNGGEYAETPIPSKMGNIYVKVLKEGDGEEKIYFTSTVKCYYKGTFINGEEFDKALPPYQDPVTFYVGESGLRDGFAAALQYMKVGDKWEVWMPQELAYGASGNKPTGSSTYTILPYSALCFEIEVVEIVKQ